jgi:hypothetical protein
MLPIFFLLDLVLSGMIETLDFSMDYINVGFTTEMSFVFKLE